MFKKSIEYIISRIIKNYIISLILVILVTIILSYVTYKRFKIKTSLTILLPQEQESVLNLKELEKRKGSTDNLVIILENNNLDDSKEFSQLIHDSLKDDPLFLSVEHRKDVTFLKDRLLLQLSKKELLTIKTKIKEKISKTKFDTVTNLGLDDEDINPEMVDSEGDILDSEGDPFKDNNIKSKKLAKLTYKKENEKKGIIETYINENENLDGEGDPFKKGNLADEDENDFDGEGDPFKKGKNKKEEKKESILKTAEKHKKESNFLLYMNNKFNSYSESFSGRFKEWRVSYDKTVLVIMATPAKPASNINFAKKVKKHLDEVIKQLKKKYKKFSSIIVSYRGAYITVLAETNGIKHDMFSSIGVSLFLMLLLLYLYFGRLRALFILFVPLLMGMIWTSGAYFIFGTYLNIIAAFIFAILLGLGIDFGIHILTRYFEEKKNHSVEEAIIISLTNTGKAITIGGLTTIAAFSSLILADFKGFSQFGIIASLGIALNLASIYIVFPLLILLAEKSGGFKESRNFYIKIYKFIFKKKNNFTFMNSSKLGLALILLLFVSLVSAIYLKPPKFEYNFSKLNKKVSKKKKKKKKVNNKYKTATRQSLSPIIVMTNSTKETKEIYDVLSEITKYEEDEIDQPAIFPILKGYQTLYRYNNSKTLKMVASIYSFYPDDQKEKQKILEDIDKMLTPSRLKHLNKKERDAIDEMRPYIKNAKAFKLEELPEFVKSIFKEKSGVYDQFIFIYTKVNTSNGKNAINLAKEIRSIRVNGKKLKATGQPLIFADILLIMIRDSFKISLYAFMFIIAILLVLEKSVKRTILLLIPLILGILLTLFLMVLLDIKLNFFNMSVIPALIGMGIDNSVHFMHAVDELGYDDITLAYKKVIGSITMATLTTIIGFAGLLLANHSGLNTIGSLAITGMASMWIMIALPMPLLVQYLKNKK